MLKVGQQVKSDEHLPATTGTVLSVNDNGDAKIEWVTPPSSTLPYGCINTEFWPLADQKLLTGVKWVVSPADAFNLAAMEDYGRSMCLSYGISWESCHGTSWPALARWALVLAADEVKGNPNVIYSYGRDMMYHHAARHMVSGYLNEPQIA